MNRKTQSKKIQKTTIHTVRNYLEQMLETRGKRCNIRYVTADSKTAFRLQDGFVGTMHKDRLSFWSRPIKRLGHKKPQNTKRIRVNSIRIQEATCCKKCHTWRSPAAISRCSCGGYLVPRKRFHTGTLESWDAEYLEVRSAQRDAKMARRIEGTPRKQRYSPRGISGMLAGISSEQTETDCTGVALVPRGNRIVKVPEKEDVKRCSLFFKATMYRKGRRLAAAEIREILSPDQGRTDQMQGLIPR